MSTRRPRPAARNGRGPAGPPPPAELRNAAFRRVILSIPRGKVATYGQVAAAFQEETKLFVRSVIRENHSVLDILGANYTYLNGKLAQVYGIPGVIGPGFRRVSLAANPERGGLLGQGSVLLLTSHSTKTSPILRGKWILDNLLDSPPPPPPPGVPPLNESPDNGRKLTTRQQVERHRANAVCAHQNWPD